MNIKLVSVSKTRDFELKISFNPMKISIVANYDDYNGTLCKRTSTKTLEI